MRYLIPAAVVLIFMTLGPFVVSGHALVIEYGVESVYVEAYYGGITPIPVQYADVEVFYPDGRLYIEGKTDENGIFVFDPVHKNEWLVVVESTGHKEDKIINISAAGGMKCETPLYFRVLSGLGYLLGIIGISLWYTNFKKARKMKDK